MKSIIVGIVFLATSLQLTAQLKTRVFDEVFYYIDNYYVDSVNDKELIETAIVSMLQKLDPHSSFISKEEVEEANQSIVGSFVGVGVRFRIIEDTFTVMEVIPQGPSQKVGLLPGDKFVTVDDSIIAGVKMKSSDIRNMLLGEKDTKVKIGVKRNSEPKLINFVITRDKIPLHSVSAAYMIDNKTGYIKLTSFSRTTTEETEDAIKKLKKQGMKDLVLDLQSNGGGLLSAAHQLADQFLSGDKMIVYSKGRAQPKREFKTSNKNAFEKGRLVILTNEHSASASEIVSGAIQDWDRGLIVGRRTFGKGLVQRPINLTDGSQVRLTIARYYTPSGRFIQKPYKSYQEYRKDLLNRYENGEYYYKDSIHFVDSLKVKTLIKGRTVYGGGGIMPDIFVPYDTTGTSDFLSKLIRKGVVSNFLAQFVNENRANLLEKHPTYEAYKSDFKISQPLLDDLFNYALEKYEVEYNEEQFKISEELLLLNIRAIIAQSLYGIPAFYKVMNAKNEALQKALEVLNSDKYNKAGLAKL